MPPSLSTRHELLNGNRFPSVQIIWRSTPEIGPGSYTGDLTVWMDSHTKDPNHHTVNIGQSAPLGSVHFQFDGIGYGCWENAAFPGVSITERDLQWATAWAVLALKSRRKQGDLPAIPGT